MKDKVNISHQICFEMFQDVAEQNPDTTPFLESGFVPLKPCLVVFFDDLGICTSKFLEHAHFFIPCDCV